MLFKWASSCNRELGFSQNDSSRPSVVKVIKEVCVNVRIQVLLSSFSHRNLKRCLLAYSERMMIFFVVWSKSLNQFIVIIKKKPQTGQEKQDEFSFNR